MGIINDVWVVFLSRKNVMYKIKRVIDVYIMLRSLDLILKGFKLRDDKNWFVIERDNWL